MPEEDTDQMNEWIVVADKNTSVFRDAGQILCKQKMRVTGFISGQELMDFLKDNRPDLILLGNVMWDLGGFEVISVIRQMTGPGEEIPILLMADQEDHDLEMHARSSGAAGVVTKPLSSTLLITRVREIFAKRSQMNRDKTMPAGEFLDEVVASLEECNDSANGIWIDKKAFASVYHHMLRYMERYNGIAFQILFTLEIANSVPKHQYGEIVAQFRHILQLTMRDSDMMMQNGDNQFFLVLPEVKEADISGIISRVINEWKRTKIGSLSEVVVEVKQVKLNSSETEAVDRNRPDWVVIVDDDVANLKLAGLILSKQHIRVTALKSGRALLEYVKENRPDLILMDIRMPELDGFETMRQLKQYMTPGQEIPVIFLTSDDNAQSELKGLNLGAMDFIRKPFVPEVLTTRVRHTIDLVKLQKRLAHEVEVKTQENEALFLHVVQTLAEAIDAKDTYTNGHSSRVAGYAREIARRFGYSIEEQEEIYMMGLLHDVGKIGIPDSVINKPSRLTDEEYAQIKSHSVMGDKILKKIRERPKLAGAARWHHERYDGTGYPDGLAGEDIPEECRIIAVADAYDAMTSYRSYRSILPQEIVRQEIENGKGTQFDPVFADIMLQIIADDPDYKLKEN